MAKLRRPPLKATIITLLLGVLSSLIAAYLFQFFPFQRPAYYLIRITVVSPTKVPVDDARVWSNLGGELKGVKGGYELSLPTEQFSSQDLEVFAEVPEEGWIGHATVHLNQKYTVEVNVPLAVGGEPDVRGSVIDGRGLGVPGAIVTVIGYGSKQVISDAIGGFSLPSHAGAGATVLVHAEKSPDLREMCKREWEEARFP